MGQEDSSGVGNGNAIQYSAWEILQTEEPGGSTVHEVTKRQRN